MTKHDQQRPEGLKTALSRIQSLADKHKQLSQEVRKLRDLLNTQDNWHSEVQAWMRKKVSIFYGNAQFQGTLKWTDRYTICLQAGNRIFIFPKGASAIMHEEY